MGCARKDGSRNFRHDGDLDIEVLRGGATQQSSGYALTRHRVTVELTPEDPYLVLYKTYKTKYRQKKKFTYTINSGRAKIQEKLYKNAVNMTPNSY